MRAVLLTGRGGFDHLDVRDDVPVPEPRPGQVLIQVAAAAVNNTDINTRIGWYAPDSLGSTAAAEEHDPPAWRADVGWSGETPEYPRIQGADACGRIVAVGSPIDAPRIGERVIVDPVFTDTDGTRQAPIYFGSDVDGAFAEYTVVPSSHAVHVESSWTDVELASLPCSYSAAENMLARVDASSHDTIVVTGASGGVGSAAVQLAKRRGARVVALAAAAKHDEVQSLGADMVLPRDTDLVALLGQRAVDVVIDVVGGPAWPQLLDVLRRGGRYATSGAIAGHWVELDLRMLYLNDLTLYGCTILGAGVFSDLVGYVERDEIRPVIAVTFPLSEIVAAQRLFLTKQHVGKIVLTVADT
ncbi:MAG TPA: zinc-binding dehydrogenase [Ilumatobacteraceae bacterium]|nr:zinc-binding dehydrogenase [Ilumatobacteraceae bacterium]